MGEEKEVTLDELFKELDEMIENLEDKDVSLEKSFELYSEGMKKIRKCSDKIDKVEKKVLMIDEEGSFHEL